MNERLEALLDEVVTLASEVKTGGNWRPGDIVMIEGKRGNRRGMQIHYVLVEKKGRRWRAWGWPQKTPQGIHYEGGNVTIPIQMMEEPTVRFTDRERLDYFEKGQESWGVLDEKKQERRQKRRDRAQERFDRYDDVKLDKDTPYFWPKGNYGMNRGYWTGEIRDGKAKMKRQDVDSFFGGGRGSGRTVWILLDRLFTQKGSRYLRVV